MALNEAGHENARLPPTCTFRVHRAVFLPTLAITVLYGSLWIWFSVVQATSEGVSRAALLVLAVGVPLLVVHAGLRYVNGHLELRPREIVASPGWPVRREKHVAYPDIVEIRLRRGVIGRVLDVGSLIIVDRRGGRTVMPDLATPQHVADVLRSRMEADADVSNRGGEG